MEKIARMFGQGGATGILARFCFPGTRGKSGTVLLRLRSRLTGLVHLCCDVNRSKSVSLLPCKEETKEMAGAENLASG